MPKWVNSDGLIVKFGRNEADPVKGGVVKSFDNVYRSTFTIDAADIATATSTILGNVSSATDGAYGVTIPKGARIKGIETVVQTAFTVSAGTVAAGTLELGLKQLADLSTSIADGGFLTTSATGTVLGLGTVGTRTYTTIGSTGVGTLVGTTTAANGVVCCRNSTHPTNTYNAGRLLVTVEWFYP